MADSKAISDAFLRHYTRKIRHHGPNARGLDWMSAADVASRYAKMLEVIRPADRGGRPSLLDVGCGYGGLFGHARESGLDLDYTGIDLVAETIAHGRGLYPGARFVVDDVLDWKEDGARFDYVVCSGILTLKLATGTQDMHRYFASVVRRLFALCRKGIAFNVLSSHADTMASNLYYRSPVEVLAFCMAELSPKVRLDHAYPLPELTTYVYRE